MNRPVPRTVPGWLKEINLAIAGAREAEPFGELIGEPITDANLFQPAPLVCLKFGAGSWWGQPRNESPKRLLLTTS